MKIHMGFHSWPISKGQVAASLGNYDGVHVGHQAILKGVVTAARDLSIPSVAITFDPVPRKVLAPESAPPLIQTLEQRLSKLASLDLDHTIVVAFDQQFAQKSPEDFVHDFLVDTLGIRCFVVGEHFSFGHQKRGNIELLHAMGRRYGFAVEAVPEVRAGERRVSSTLVRECILLGDMEAASTYLGSPVSLTGTVVEGEKLGARLGIPTANLNPENEIQPANGVYVTRVIVESQPYRSVTNVGIRPTVGGKKWTVESHLLQFSGDLYRKKIELQFLKRIREEIRFASVDDLKSQIYNDIESTRRYFGD